MIDFFQNDTDENRQSLLTRARKVALSAMQQYDLAWKSIRFIQLSDSITYKIETNPGTSYLLRIHSDRWSEAEIRSELAMLEALNKSDDLNVPEGLASRNGSFVLEMDTEDGYRRPYVTLMRWVEGEHHNGEFTDSCVYNMGVMMGRLHDAAACFVPTSDFVRPAWGSESFRQEIAKLERYYSCFLSDEAWGKYQAAAEKILSELAIMHQTAHNYGLIHGDLHTGNIVFDGDEPRPIDFGRCGYGHYLYDIASTLIGLYPKHRRILIEGYESVRKLEAGYARQLDCFFIMVMIGNYSHHASDSRETSSLIDQQQYAQALIGQFLKDQPFLFDAIEPVEIDRSAIGGSLL
ncbi:phosphotransferase enzyme family protein [Paenibacillus radicis (ex Gao et al. 2016)]|uniref:Aminoglycoside phosphotransferase n=1 Tax=Paenibacillus radicis (ex Gao et al. 2016) TaxID=1737354 RepID=A0A917M102_9BACL|nr:phosphotransferase [Paenibacillus radicis (ex Gao et al. 2016)]GGG72253.1 aminoglycoside phosphotransferase [Paenibacillus radicis (ex Gao et al. 2016)]